MDVLALLKHVDLAVFFTINKTLSASWLNQPMLLLRNQYTWIPLYLFLLIYFYTRCRKYLVPIILLSLVTFAITDFTSASIIKPLVARHRPCNDPSVQFELNNIAGCGGPYSMPSSHASNHFGLAAFWFLVISNIRRKKWYWLWIWAFAIGYAQVYVGVHFPTDIFVGACLGIVTAFLTFRIFTLWKNRIDNKTPIPT